MTRVLSHVLLVVFSLVIFSSCSKNVDSVATTTTDANLFVSATPAGSFSKDLLKSIAISKGYGQFADQVKYDVDFFIFVYNTSYNGKTIQASGLLGIPKNMPVAPSILSAQRGTIFKDTDAPSNFPTSSTGFELFASAGYITAIPDLIGFGTSKDIVHPYYDQKLSGTAVVDMLKAVKTYVRQQKIAYSNRLFLFGYSEGGYVTMAAQKEIETHPADSLTVTAAAEAAGGYDLSGMLSAVASTASYAEPSYLAFVIQSYNSTYDWKRPYTDFFKEPYASKIPSLLDGSKSGADIDAELTTSTVGLFNPVFLSSLSDPTKEPVLKQALKANSFPDWVPKSPTRLYHGTADVTVFYQTSVTTFNYFKSTGATNVEFFPIQGGDHETSVKPTLANALPWFQSLDK